MVKISEKHKKLIEGSAVALATSDLWSRPNVVAVACAKVVSHN